MALEWLYGPKVTQDAGDVVNFGTFLINATDVENIRMALGDDAGESSRAHVYRGDPFSGALRPIDELSAAIDGDLGELAVVGPGGRFLFGSGRTAILMGGGESGWVERRVIDIVVKSGRHRMGRHRLLIWLELLVVLALIAAWLSYALRREDPSLSLLTAVGVAAACGWMHSWRRNYCATKDINRYSGIVSVDPTPVSVLRAQRWNRGRDFRVGLWTFLGTAAAALVTVWLTGGRSN